MSLSMYLRVFITISPGDELVAELKKEEKKALKKLEMEQDNRMRAIGANPEAVKYAEEKYQIDVHKLKTSYHRYQLLLLDSLQIQD